jgi:hypothetical protein
VAKETITKLIDDLDGGVAHETVTFGLDGTMYEIDLSTKHARKLRTDLAVYLEHGSAVVAVPAARAARGGSARAGSGRTGSRRDGSGRVGLGRGSVRDAKGVPGDKDVNRAIREWAAGQGFAIAARGRIKQDLIDAYHRSGGH